MKKCKEYQELVEIAKNLESHYSQRKHEWEGSPFEWILRIPSRQKGAVGEELVRQILAQRGFNVSSSQGTDSDMRVEERNVEVKFSTLWETGVYKFQQIRDQNYDILLCLGISPDTAHAWVVPKANIGWTDLSNQHGGSRGTDTWWISFTPPACPYRWMRPHDGDLSAMCDELQKLTQKSR